MDMRSSVFALISVFLSIWALPAKAGIEFGIAGSYRSAKTISIVSGASSTLEDDRVFSGDLDVGYTSPEGAYLGVIYKTATPIYQGDSRASMNGYGATVGYTSQGLFFRASYLTNANYFWHLNGVDYAYTAGSGFQFALGYYFLVAPWWGFGPQISWSDIKYTSTQINQATPTADSFEKVDFDPYVSVLFFF